MRRTNGISMRDRRRGRRGFDFRAGSRGWGCRRKRQVLEQREQKLGVRDAHI